MKFQKATRERVPLICGLYGLTGSGKTYSALMLATGIARNTGKPIAFVDTESGRAKHYADKFEFSHLSLDPPFTSTRYLEAMKAAAAEGFGVVVIDSMTHEHSGSGGLLEQHDSEVQRISREWRVPASVAGYPAWQAPKRVRQGLLDELARCSVDVIMCFRAKERIRMPTREERDGGQREPINVGLCPIGGDELAYEALLFAGIGRLGKGVPDWTPTGERAEDLTKFPEQLHPLFKTRSPLSVEDGERLSMWASGMSTEAILEARPLSRQKSPIAEPPDPETPADDSTISDYMRAINAVSDRAGVLELLETLQRATVLTSYQRQQLKAALKTRSDSIRAAKHGS